MQTKTIPDHITAQGFSGTILKRFFSRIEYTDTCWLWTGYVMKNGYGSISKGPHSTSCVGGVSVLAHRTSWLIHFGAIPDGLFVCHECDTSRCVNPAHLWLGTHKENMADMKRKGRESHNVGMFTGEKSYMAKLTWEKVRQIRSEYIPYRVSIPALAEKYGVVQSVISAIIRNEIWKDDQWKEKGSRVYKLSEEQMKDIQSRFTNRIKFDLAEEFRVSGSTIYNVARTYHKY